MAVPHPYPLTSLKAFLSSLMPIMSAVSARSLGPINPTKSSKSTWPPTEKKTKLIFHKSQIIAEESIVRARKLTIHVDLLAQFDEFHFGGHVAHSSHAVSEILAADETIFIFIKLLKSFSQLCARQDEQNTHEGHGNTQCQKETRMNYSRLLNTTEGPKFKRR